MLRFNDGDAELSEFVLLIDQTIRFVDAPVKAGAGGLFARVRAHEELGVATTRIGRLRRPNSEARLGLSHW